MGLIGCPELSLTTNQCCIISQGSENLKIVTCMMETVFKQLLHAL